MAIDWANNRWTTDPAANPKLAKLDKASASMRRAGGSLFWFGLKATFVTLFVLPLMAVVLLALVGALTG